jgi:predicted nuclease of predicted toxin-antitoxin system
VFTAYGNLVTILEQSVRIIKATSDKQVMALAMKEKRLILTFDKDYGELIFNYGYKLPAGVIFLRLAKYTP